MTRGATTALALLLLALAVGFAACDSRDPAPVRPVVPRPTYEGEPLKFEFRLDGPRPWNDTVYVAVGDEVDAGEPYRGKILAKDGSFLVTGPPGAPYHIRSEIDPSAAEERMLWMVDARGTFGATKGAAPILVTAPPRAHAVLLARSGAPGPDSVTFFEPKTSTCATAYRDPRHAYFLAVWDADGGNAYRNVAPPRPWTIDELAPGEYVAAGRTEGRQWTARRVRVSPDEPIEIDAGSQPEGGGTVICENAQALLLLGGKLPIPAPRITLALHYRSTWKGVPPGTHRVRYPDGREVDVVVTDGGESKLGR